MSPKKNILYNLYIETKIILNELVVHDSLKLEKSIKLTKLQEIDDLFVKVQQKLAREAVKKTESSTIIDSISFINDGDTVVTPNIDHDTLTLPQNTENEDEDLDTSVDFALLRKQVEEDYFERVSKIRSFYDFEVFQQYRELFKDYDFYNSYKNLLSELFVVDSLSSSEFVKKFTLKTSNYIPVINSFNIKYILYMEDFLFSWLLQSLFQKKFWKLKKIKFKKWKFKKKKLRKLYVLKKIRKFIRFKRFKQKNFFLFQKLNHYTVSFSKIPKNILVQKIPLTEKIINTYNVEFFYKLNKKAQLQNFSDDWSFFPSDYSYSKFSIYSRNYHQKPYLKLRRSRVLHWNLFYKKTIRKQRYKSFLNRFMKKYTNFSYDYTFIVNLFTKFCISWTRTSKLPSIAKLLILDKKDKIIKLPLFFNKVFNWRFLKKRNYILKKKIGRWSFLNFKRFKFPWLQRKKHSPKGVNHIQPNIQTFFQLGYLDKLTGYFMLNTELKKFTLPALETFKANSLIKLHMYRYKSNNKWI